MLKIFNPNDVLYLCTCGAEKHITKTYFCRHCSKLRCGDCVTHEVDSHYCQSCLEYMPSQEARIKKNKCLNCFNCPSCQHNLSVRTTTTNPASGGSDEASPASAKSGDSAPVKVYYLTCGFCRWTSRDVKMPDQRTSTGGWQEEENLHSKRISQLMDYYKSLAHTEKLEKEKKIKQRFSFIHISEKYGMSSTVVRKLRGLPTVQKVEKEPEKAPQLAVPEPSSDMEPIPETYLTEPLDLNSICTVKQRLSQPQFQPVLTSELRPTNRYMSIRRSQRCKECEHNLSKSEYNPSSIKFKIQMAAYYHVPELRIKTVSKLYLGKLCRMEVVLINPTPYPAHVTFEPVEEPSDQFSPVNLPPGEFVLSKRDDTAEFDDMSDTQSFIDDPNIVTFRNSNKLGFMFSLTPSTKDVVVSFKMRHDFVNVFVTLPGEQPKEPQIIWLTHTLKIKLGTVVGES